MAVIVDNTTQFEYPGCVEDQSSEDGCPKWEKSVAFVHESFVAEGRYG